MIDHSVAHNLSIFFLTLLAVHINNSMYLSITLPVGSSICLSIDSPIARSAYSSIELSVNRYGKRFKCLHRRSAKQSVFF